MCKLCLKSFNCLEGENSVGVGQLIFPAIKERILYNMEKFPEMNGSGERTWNMRRIDKKNIPITPLKYMTGYSDNSIQPNANLPAYPFCQK